MHEMIKNTNVCYAAMQSHRSGATGNGTEEPRRRKNKTNKIPVVPHNVVAEVQKKNGNHEPKNSHVFLDHTLVETCSERFCWSDILGSTRLE